MLEITLTKEGFRANQVVSDKLLSSDNCVKIICAELYYNSETSLMNLVCEYINSLNPTGTKVRPNIAFESHSGTNSTGHYIKKLTFQIII